MPTWCFGFSFLTIQSRMHFWTACGRKHSFFAATRRRQENSCGLPDGLRPYDLALADTHITDLNSVGLNFTLFYRSC